jgi:hypothetical protein
MANVLRRLLGAPSVWRFYRSLGVPFAAAALGLVRRTVTGRSGRMPMKWRP